MNKNNTYTFDGNWEFQLEIDSLNNFSWEKTNPNIKFIIRDFLTDEVEPDEEQIACINYILKNQNQIEQTILDTIWKNWQEINEIHELDDWEEFPIIEKKNDLYKVVRIDHIYIHPAHKNNISYFGVLGNCRWDEEHGLGILFHRNSVIEFGGAEEADAGGREANDSPDNPSPKELDIPKLYKAHPKYGTFKPSHQEANINYPHKLIERGLNQEFINYFLDNPDPDFIHPEDGQKRTYLQTACIHNNEPIFNILIPVVKNFKKAIYNAHKRKNIYFIEQLVERGADIHETHFGTTILSEAVEQHLRLVANNLTEEQMDANHQRMIDFSKGVHTNKFSPTLQEMLIHPKEKIKRSKIYLEKIIGYGIALDENKIAFVKQGYQHNSIALKAIDKEVKWIEENYN